MSSNFVE